jgi:hypothetical protein
MELVSAVWKPGMRARIPSGEIVEVFEVYEGDWLGGAYFEVHVRGQPQNPFKFLARQQAGSPLAALAPASK